MEAEQARPGTDDLIIARMKRQKLHLKDEIQKLTKH
ncbi:MAG: YdcH family protein [Pseudomonadota bacterium]